MSAPVRIMFDLETLSTASNACVLSIGAVVFGGPTYGEQPLPGETAVPREFYLNVDDPSGNIDLSTVRWWLRQEKAAQERLDSLASPAVTLDQALFQFATWCSLHATGTLTGIYEKKADVEFWSRSPSFDEVILTSAYRRAETRSPFFHRWSRDHRTIEVAAGIPYKPTTGLAHCALSDSRVQAEHVTACLAKLAETR